MKNTNTIFDSYPDSKKDMLRRKSYELSEAISNLAFAEKKQKEANPVKRFAELFSRSLERAIMEWQKSKEEVRQSRKEVKAKKKALKRALK